MSLIESRAIPQAIREAIDARDGTYCRVCGQFLGDRRALHHIVYGGVARGMGGRRRHVIDEIVTVCWLTPGNCHDLVHADKHIWQPLLLQVVHRPGLTAFQLHRWEMAKARVERAQRHDPRD